LREVDYKQLQDWKLVVVAGGGFISKILNVLIDSTALPNLSVHWLPGGVSRLRGNLYLPYACSHSESIQNLFRTSRKQPLCLNAGWKTASSVIALSCCLPHRACNTPGTRRGSGVVLVGREQE